MLRVLLAPLRELAVLQAVAHERVRNAPAPRAAAAWRPARRSGPRPHPRSRCTWSTGRAPRRRETPCGCPAPRARTARACDRAWEPPQTASGRRRAPRPRGPPRRGFRSASKLREWSQMTSASSDASEGGRPSARRRATMASRHAGTAKRRMSASTPSGTTRRPPASASSAREAGVVDVRVREEDRDALGGPPPGRAGRA